MKTTKNIKKSDKSEKVQITKRQKDVQNFCKVLSQVNNSSTKLTEVVRTSLIEDRDLLTGTALYLYTKETSKSQRLNTLQRTIKRVSKSMSKEEGSEITPVKLKIEKKGEKVFYKFVDNLTTEQDKFQLLVNHILREKDNLTPTQLKEVLDLLK
tara:strand:- start:119 stop:580 length:462 start_codon:yes stop_codon:yes gene_type:complete